MKNKILLFSFLSIPVIIILLANLKLDSRKNLTIKLIPTQEYGNPTNDDILGMITDFFIDHELNLYVADDAFKVIRKYSVNGKAIRKFGFGAGKGPGEFSNIQSLHVDSLLNIYVVDKINSNITIFDSTNNLLYTRKLLYMPAQLCVSEPMNVDILGFPFTYKGDLIHRYNFSVGDSVVITYAQRPNEKRYELGFLSGNSGRLVKDQAGFIYYSYFYPYVIKKFSPNGQLVNLIEDEMNLPAPFRSSGTNIIESPAGIKELAVLPNNKLLVLFVEKNGEELIQSFHLWDSENGEFLGAIPCKDLGLNFVRFIRSDNEGNIYLDFIDPYPHIVKYKLTFEQY